MRLLAALCLTIGQSVLTAIEETVVSLARSSGANTHAHQGSSHWVEQVFINDTPFTCRLKEDANQALEAAHRVERNSKLLALAGQCFQSAESNGLNLCPNDRVDFRGQQYLMSKETAIDVDQSFAGRGNGEPSIVLHCDYMKHLQARQNQKLCRPGSVVGSAVITSIFSNQTAELKSVTGSNRPVMSEHAQIPGCDTLGIHDSIDRLMHITSVSTAEGPTRIGAESPLCFPGSSLPVDQLLLPLSNVCLTGELFHRQFEVCFTEPRMEFRVLQLGHRLNHAWPTAAPFRSTHMSDWTIDSHSRKIERRIKTDQSCRSLETAFTEEFRITVLSTNSFSLRAVSGPFSPMVVSNEIEGILVSDSSDPSGCSESAFEAQSRTSGRTPWIALVRRGGCLFQEKALFAQRKGAVGIVIVNRSKRAMIPAMASVVGKPVSDIPAVLTDRDGVVLDKFIGSNVRLSPAPFPGQSRPGPDQKLEVLLRMGCHSIEKEFSQQCVVGQEVLMQVDGDLLKHPVVIVEKLNPELYIVSDAHDPRRVVPGWSLFKDGDVPCTGQLGSFVADVQRTDSCEITVDMHSALLCGDAQFRPPLMRRNDIQCTLVQQESYS